MAADLDRAYVINGDDLRIALSRWYPRDPRAAAEHILDRVATLLVPPPERGEYARLPADDDVVDAHICCEHADGPGPFSDPEVAAMAALTPALPAVRRLKHDEAMRVMRWATDRATDSLPPF
jgi:hypothetical protein